MSFPLSTMSSDPDIDIHTDEANQYRGQKSLHGL